MSQVPHAALSCPSARASLGGGSRQAVSMLSLGLISLLQACSPALDWRQARPEAWGVVLLMPCRPDQHERTVPLAEATVKLGLLVCQADDHTFALASAAMADPGQVGPALQALARSAQINLQAMPSPPLLAQVKGMTPRPEAGHWQLQGQMPDGRPVSGQVLVFAHGLRVFQATLIGPRADAALAQSFFGQIELLP